MTSGEVVKNFTNKEDGSINEKVPLKSKEYGHPNLKKKCFRKGSRICYTDMENITMLKKIPEKDTSQISIIGQPEKAIYDKVDSYRSGESLFKTFTFEQTRDIDDPETLKCIEFWKGVMQKNLAPIKCTLIESDKKRFKEEKKKSLTESKKVSQPEKCMVGAAKMDFAADQDKIWFQALKEIRNRKLDRLKLYVKERCEYCRDPFTKNFADEIVDESEEQTAQIEALNEWKPKADGKNKNHSKESLMTRISSKIKRISATQTTEIRVKAQISTENAGSTTNSKTPNAEHTPFKQSDSKIATDIKQISSVTQESSGTALPTSSYRTSNLLKVSEVQVPGIKCACDSNSCICPHKAAPRKSRTSLVQTARRSMVQEDNSNENITTTYEDTCICKTSEQPWESTICSTEPCIIKYPTIEESSSDFNLNRFLETVEKHPTCICGKLTDVECSSDKCNNKQSQGSLFEGIQTKDINNSCVCGSTDIEVTCMRETCSKKPSKVSDKCICRDNKPWCELKCQSWSCRSQKNKFRKKIRNDDVEIKLEKYSTAKEVTSTCVCDTSFPWKNVRCLREDCTDKPEAVEILRDKTKRSSKLGIKKERGRYNRKSKEILIDEEQTNLPQQNENYVKSREIIKGEQETFLSSLNEENLKSGEIKNNNQITTQKNYKCICSTSVPWSVVSCSTHCETKERMGKKNEVTESPSRISSSKMFRDISCICDDKTLEPICGAFKCDNRNLEVDYPPPCICPVDLEEGKQDYLRCASEKCNMKKIDQSCVCSATPEAPCNNKKCAEKPQPSTTLKYAHKNLKYDTKCLCKVRGLPTTEEVNCAASDCPFKKKQKLPNYKTPIAITPVPYGDVSTQNEQTNKIKCTCNTANIDTLCTNLSCRGKKSKKKSSITEENVDDEEIASCICNNIDSAHEVICRQVQCQKVSVSNGGIMMNDKCVCATMDSPCSEPLCPKMIDQYNEQIDIEGTANIDRPYCYICGHYDCISNKNTTEEEEEGCGKYNNNDENKI